MNESHYCELHDIAFFKRGKMRRYAHPIKDTNGEDTGAWCNEGDIEKLKELPAQEPPTDMNPPKAEPPLKSQMSNADWAEKDRVQRLSIESQVSFKGIIELMVAKIIKPEDELGRAVINYAKSRLMETPTSAKQQPPKLKSEPTGATFKDVGEFKTFCNKELKMTVSQIDKETAQFDLTTEEGRSEAWIACLANYGQEEIKSK